MLAELLENNVWAAYLRIESWNIVLKMLYMTIEYWNNSMKQMY